MGLAMAPMVAPTIGGLLQELYGWTAIFWFMAGLGVLCLGVVWAYIPETNLRPAAELSFRSMFRDFGRLLCVPDFLLFTASSALTTGIFFAFLGGAPYIAERLLGLSPSIYGLWFGILPIGYASGSFIAGRFTERLGVPRMILLGSLLALAAAIVLPSLALLGFAGPAALFVPMAVSGMANGMALPSAVSGAISVRPEIAGAAAGLSGAAQIGTGAIFSGLGGWALTGATTPMPLFAIMMLAAALAILTALAIWRRSRVF
jgi:DHA1 family bicyclomycin/chloramphenicol resistance-like MFS transporter